MTISRRKMARRLHREWRPGKAVICDHDWEMEIVVDYDHVGCHHLLVSELDFTDETFETQTYALWFVGKNTSSVVKVWEFDFENGDMPPYIETSHLVQDWVAFGHEINWDEYDD